ncbi:MAG: Fe-S cluster assembly protein HesB [Nocardioidaceae bacterium]
MLTLTENASSVVKSITEQNTPDEGAGLRIVQDPSSGDALELSVAPTPQPGDQVVEDQGARLFLEEGAAATLEDKVLDAHVDTSGSVEFSLAVQD